MTAEPFGYADPFGYRVLCIWAAGPLCLDLSTMGPMRLQDVNFRNFLQALLLLLRVATGDNW